MKIRTSVKGLWTYISGLTDRRYAEAPLLEGKLTRREALKYLRELTAEGKQWIE